MQQRTKWRTDHVSCPPSPALLTNFWFLRESGWWFPIKIMVEEQEQYCLNTTKAAFYSEVKWFKYGQGNWVNWIPFTILIQATWNFIIPLLLLTWLVFGIAVTTFAGDNNKIADLETGERNWLFNSLPIQRTISIDRKPQKRKQVPSLKGYLRLTWIKIKTAKKNHKCLNKWQLCKIIKIMLNY